MASEDSSNFAALKTSMEKLNVQPSSSSQNDEAAAVSDNGVEVTCFTEVLDDVTLHLQIIHLGKQIYAWIGCNSGKLGHLYAAAPTRPFLIDFVVVRFALLMYFKNNTASVTCVLGGNSDNTGTGIARRLVLKTGLNIMLASNVPKNSPLLEANAEKKLVEKLIHLGGSHRMGNSFLAFTPVSCTFLVEFVAKKDIVAIMPDDVSNITPPPGALASISDASPVHYIVKMESFSLVTKNAVEKHESGVFEAGGYKCLIQEKMMPLSNVLALLPRLDAAGKETRFHGLKFSWGFDQFVKLSTFNDARHGFLLDDSCVFGAEVFVRKERSRGTGELLSMIKQPDPFEYTWKIKNFSKLDEKRQESEIFSMADQKWKIVLYPKGKGRGMGTHLSLYLALDLATLPTGYRLYTEYTLRILNQFWGRESDRYVKGKNTNELFAWKIIQQRRFLDFIFFSFLSMKKEFRLFLRLAAKHWFDASSSERGWARFISQDIIYQPNGSYVVKDTCIVEAEGETQKKKQRERKDDTCATLAEPFEWVGYGARRHQEVCSSSRHFRTYHFLCEEEACLADEFVVFISEIDFMSAWCSASWAASIISLVEFVAKKDIVAIMPDDVSNITPPPGALASISDASPVHYIVKMESFSLVTKNAVEKHESGVFEAGGYKCLIQEKMMPLSNVLALLPRLDAAGKETRFHGLKFSWGFDQFVKLSTFNDARHGFLLDDSCVFGAEVFVRKERSRGTGELLSMIKQPDPFEYTWKIKNFSKLDEKRQESEIFSMADQKWKIVLYPKGKGRGMGTHLSLYLALDLATLPTGYRLYTEYTLRILNQFWGRESDRYVKGKNTNELFAWKIIQQRRFLDFIFFSFLSMKKEFRLFLRLAAKHWFDASSSERGWARFISQDIIYQPNGSYVVKDTCIVEAEGETQKKKQRERKDDTCATLAEPFEWVGYGARRHQEVCSSSRHFRTYHFLCEEEACLADEFVVFISEIDFMSAWCSASWAASIISLVEFVAKKDIVAIMPDDVSNITPPPGALASISDASPVHYIVKMESFSLVTKNAVEKHESGVFEAGGYKCLIQEKMMPLSNVLALLPRLDAAGKETRFHGLKFSWGFDQFVKLSTFNDARHGFLLDDSCVFGAEVFVRKERSRGTGELLSMIKQPDTFKYTWKIKNFSKLDEKRQESEIFSMADQKWKIVLYPKGKGRGMGTHLSLYLALDLATLPTGYRLYTEYTLRILNQFWGRESDRYVKGKNTNELFAWKIIQQRRFLDFIFFSFLSMKKSSDCFFVLQLNTGLMPQAQKQEGQDLFHRILFISQTDPMLLRTLA
ncbi:unnamed protein product [Dovyalis caffra]|uniref:MATH domain-containing protein n=1 Tax=Dovyalis caffra TaxID=77055 RepID=A0AAV1QZN6_9ROSI|nr:unnamed protein product [Dovyalis caffra]